MLTHGFLSFCSLGELRWGRHLALGIATGVPAAKLSEREHLCGLRLSTGAQIAHHGKKFYANCTGLEERPKYFPRQGAMAAPSQRKKTMQTSHRI